MPKLTKEKLQRHEEGSHGDTNESDASSYDEDEEVAQLVLMGILQSSDTVSDSDDEVSTNYILEDYRRDICSM